MSETRLPYARNAKDLVVYQRQRELARQFFLTSKRFPREELYSLTDQIRRSSRSIGAQIAEAWAKRRYENHFVSKLTDADAENQETLHWIDTAGDCAYLEASEKSRLMGLCDEIGCMLAGMIARSNAYCANPTECREDEGVYFVKHDQTEY